MIRIMTADGRAIERAYSNAYAADPRMDGVRVQIRISQGGKIKASVHPGDVDALQAWPSEDVESMLLRIAESASEGALDMCDEREVEAWITRN